MPKESSSQRIYKSLCRDEKHSENLDFIKELFEMNVIAPAFIISAIARYADEYSRMDPALIEGLPMISPAAWVECAKQIRQKVEALTCDGRA